MNRLPSKDNLKSENILLNTRVCAQVDELVDHVFLNYKRIYTLAEMFCMTELQCDFS